MDCPLCDGYRLQQESSSVLITSDSHKEYINIGQLANYSVDDALRFLSHLTVKESEK